jgi:hypothetical protein
MSERGGNEFEGAAAKGQPRAELDGDVAGVGAMLDALGDAARREADTGLESRVARLSYPVLARGAGDLERELLFEVEASRRGSGLGRGSRGVRMAAGVAILCAAGFAYLAVRGGTPPAGTVAATPTGPGETGEDAMEIAGFWSDETSGEIDALFGEIGVLETAVRSGVGAGDLIGNDFTGDDSTGDNLTRDMEAL